MDVKKVESKESKKSIQEKINEKLAEIDNYSNNDEIISSNYGEDNNDISPNNQSILSSIEGDIQNDLSTIPLTPEPLEKPNFIESKEINNKPLNIMKEYQKRHSDSEKNIMRKIHSYDKNYKEDNKLFGFTPIQNNQEYLKSIYSSENPTKKYSFNYVELENSSDEKQIDKEEESNRNSLQYRKSKTSNIEFSANFRKSNLKIKSSVCQAIDDGLKVVDEEYSSRTREACLRTPKMGDESLENNFKKKSREKRNVKFSNILVTEDEKESNSNKFFECLGISLMLLFLFILLFIDPIMVITLKLIDFIKEKFSKTNKNDDSQSNDSYSNLPSDCDNKLNEELDNQNDMTYFERYNNLFFNNAIFKTYRKKIKATFIGISLFINVLILTSHMEKEIFTLLFFLNNLYLLFHTMDLYNENLIRFTEDVQWKSLINMERN